MAYVHTDLEFTAELEDCSINGIWMILPVEVGVRFDTHVSLVSYGFTSGGDYRLEDQTDVQNVVVFVRAAQDIKNCDEDGNELDTIFAKKGDCLLRYKKDEPTVKASLEKALDKAVEDYKDSMADI